MGWHLTIVCFSSKLPGDTATASLAHPLRSKVGDDHVLVMAWEINSLVLLGHEIETLLFNFAFPITNVVINFNK